MDIETANKCVKSKIKGIRLERNNYVLQVLGFPLILTGIFAGGVVASELLDANKGLTITSAILSASAAAGTCIFNAAVVQPDVVDYNVEIIRLKQLRAYLKNGVNPLENVTVEEFTKTR